MGHRTLKRVPLDFNWPIGQIWKGYINPYPGPLTCNLCEGTGYNQVTLKISKEFYDLEGTSGGWHDKITQDEVEALVANGRLIEFTHTWSRKEGWKPKRWETKGFWCPRCHVAVPQLSPEHHSCICTGCGAEMLLLEGDDIRLHIPLAEQVNKGQHDNPIDSHGVINRDILVETRAKRLGVFGECPDCNGHGEIPQPDESIRKLHEEWKSEGPPAGDGYQLWNKTDGGSPLTPVFPTAEKLAEWCEQNATIFGNSEIDKELWLKMFLEEDGMDVESGSMLAGTQGLVGPLIKLEKEFEEEE